MDMQELHQAKGNQPSPVRILQSPGVKDSSGVDVLTNQGIRQGTKD